MGTITIWAVFTMESRAVLFFRLRAQCYPLLFNKCFPSCSTDDANRQVLRILETTRLPEWPKAQGENIAHDVLNVAGISEHSACCVSFLLHISSCNHFNMRTYLDPMSFSKCFALDFRGSSAIFQQSKTNVIRKLNFLIHLGTALDSHRSLLIPEFGRTDQ